MYRMKKVLFQRENLYEKTVVFGVFVNAILCHGVI